MKYKQLIIWFKGLEALSDKTSVIGINWQKYGKGPNHSFYGTKLWFDKFENTVIAM